MLIYTKYSNERSVEFRIRTDILQMEDGSKWIRKSAVSEQAKTHIQRIHVVSQLLKRDLQESELAVNDCVIREDGVWFPYLEGDTMEVRLDLLLKKKKTEELVREIEQYFSLFAQDGLQEFQSTPEFVRVFGETEFDRKQYSRSVSDVDMIFANVMETGEKKELIDYEWSFDFPVPVKYIMYRCLHYYMLGNAVRKELDASGLYRHFDISEAEQRQFAAMERQFQQYILGAYTPIWKQYDAISDGVIEVAPLVERESRMRRQNQRTAEVFWDDGRGFGTWNCTAFELGAGARSMIQFDIPKGTMAVRIDPCSGKCLIRIEELSLNGREISWECNGLRADNGDLIFDTEDPQLIFGVTGSGRVSFSFFMEPLAGIGRELLLNQHGKIRWMEQTKVWRLYQKVKRLIGRGGQ